MKKWFKSSLATAAAISLLISTAACGQKGGSAESTTETGTTVSAQTTSKVEKVKEPVTITVFGGETGKTFSPGIQTDPVAKRIEEVTGITMDVKGNDATTSDKLKVLIAAGDLPDVVELGSDQVKSLVENKSVLQLDDLVKNNGQDIQKNATQAVAYSKKYLSNDTGNLYFLPGQIQDGKLFQIVAPYIRWDYYKELGYPSVKNFDDLLNVVAEMLKKHPTNEDGQKFYGFSPWFDWDIFSFGIFTGYMNGAQYCNDGGGLWDSFDKKYTSYIYDDNSVVWQGVSFWNKAYRMGLMDPDALTQKYDQAIQKGTQNRILCEITEWQRGSTNADLAKKGFPDRGIEPLPPFEGTDKFTGSTAQKVGNNGRLWCISSGCKNPDRAMDLLNYFFSIDGSMTINSGVEGDSWTVENGKYKLTDKFLDLMKNDPNYALTSGAFKYNSWAGLGENYKLPSGQIMKLIADVDIEKQNYLQIDKEWCSYYGIESKGDIIPKFAKRYEITELVTRLTSTQVPDDIKRDEQKIQQYIQKYLPTMVLAKTDEKFNEMKKKLQDDLKKMGVDKVFQWHSDDYSKAVASEKEFIDSLAK